MVVFSYSCWDLGRAVISLLLHSRRLFAEILPSELAQLILTSNYMKIWRSYDVIKPVSK